MGSNDARVLREIYRSGAKKEEEEEEEEGKTNPLNLRIGGICRENRRKSGYQ